MQILERDCLSMLRSSLVQPYQRVAYFQRLVRLFKPSGDWGPALVKHRRLVDYAPNFVLDPSAPAVDNPAFGYRGNYGFNISQPGDVHVGIGIISETDSKYMYTYIHTYMYTSTCTHTHTHTHTHTL